MRDRIVAHRGNAYEHRENSLDAIRSAIDLGVKYVEFDVQMSSDGVPMLLHDAYLSRLFGKDRDAVCTTSSSLEELGISSLKDAVTAVRDAAVTAFVEIKQDSFQTFGRERVVADVCRQLTGNCVVISFDHEAALAARDLGFRIGFVIGGMGADSKWRVDTFAPEYVFCDQRYINEPVWPGPIWCSYEVADAQTAHRLIRHGVQLLETMCVRRMLQ
jgi:glycerophosphoryl diester phosphodiesterase